MRRTVSDQRAYRHPAVAAQELVAHGQIRVQGRADLRRARGVEWPRSILFFRWPWDGTDDHNFGEAQMIRQALGCVVVFGCLMASAPLQAHHSTAGIYDPAKSGEVTGALSKLQFVNPHGSITITVKNTDGTTTDWTFTTGSATALAERGI